MIPGTLRELFTFNDWATPRLLDAAAERTEAELDQPFEMGEGSLRKTIFHLWGAEECWLQRWKGLPVTVSDDEVLGIEELRARFRETAAAREAWLEGQDAETMAGSFRYTRPSWMEPGPDMELNLGVSVLHILNHGVHHRAQAINMLKRMGATPPVLDYIVMRLDCSSPDLDRATLRRYLVHGDWGYHEVHLAGVALPDEARDRQFPMGCGTLRRTLCHLADAPKWWMDNIQDGPRAPFPAHTEGEAWEDLWTRYGHAARTREQFLDHADLEQPVGFISRAGTHRTFPLGVVLLQLCTHGTHHRAQALNMLRHLGAEVPGLDVAVWQRQGAPVVV